MNKKNKIWVQPELKVLVRRKPEEGILGGCKTSPIIEANSVAHSCGRITEYCGTCEAVVAS